VSQVDPVVEHADGKPDGEQQAGGKSRRRAPGADPEVRSFGTERVCAADGCQTTLSRYNPDTYCSVHRGWDRQVVRRQRRNDDQDDSADQPDQEG
jgi:hypothetical protein